MSTLAEICKLPAPVLAVIHHEDGKISYRFAAALSRVDLRKSSDRSLRPPRRLSRCHRVPPVMIPEPIPMRPTNKAASDWIVNHRQ